MLAARLEPPRAGRDADGAAKRQKGAATAAGRAPTRRRLPAVASGQALQRKVMRGVFGMLKKGF